MKKKVLLTAIAFILFMGGRFIYFEVDRTYRGRVIDADTKEPIEGAVVVAYWMEEMATIAGPSSRLKDVKETLTDEGGRWEIEGPIGSGSGTGLMGDLDVVFSIMTCRPITRKPQFIVFKPGYCPWPRPYEIEVCRERAKGHGKWYHKAISEIIELPKLTRKEDRRRAVSIGLIYDGKEALKKQIEFIRLLNKEYEYLGLPGYSVIEELENEE
jgi:hypothetical protein